MDLATVFLGERHTITRFHLPIPMGVGHINLYLLEHESGKRLLVDTGPKDATLHASLCGLLEQHGTPIESIDGLLLTHEHLDHWGGARALQERAPQLEVILHPGAHQSISGLGKDFGRDYIGVFAECGAPLLVSAAVRAFYDWYAVRRFAAPIYERNVRLVSEGPLDPYGVSLIHLPGHSAYHLGIEASGFLLAGDAVWKGKTPNPFFRRDNPDRGIQAYLDMLDTLPTKGYSMALPAHGEPVDDLRGYSEFIREHHSKRLQRLLTSLHHAKTPWGVLQDSGILRGSRRFHPAHLFLALCETLGHLEWAEDRKLCRSFLSAEGARYFTL
ncbi:MBL fold metallo-hydrolase [Candidatus Woesearchaeota archaeon]|nr:MBL fold metallo-hydrolase [Candidatus Woesearchaeota archaeon]